MKIDELKKLSSEERIRMLKEFENEKKQEIEEAQKLMAQSEHELDEQEEIRKNVPIPQLTAVSIESLFSPEEKQFYSTKRFVSGEHTEALEQAVASSQAKEEQEYAARLAQAIEEQHKRVQTIYHHAQQQIEQRGYISAETREEIRDAYNQQKAQETNQHGFNLSADIEEQLDATKGIMRNLLDWYKK